MAHASQRERRRGRTTLRRDRPSPQIMATRQLGASPGEDGGPSMAPRPCEARRPRQTASHGRSSAAPQPGFAWSGAPTTAERSPPAPVGGVAWHTLSTHEGCDRVCSGGRAGGRPTARSTEGVPRLFTRLLGSRSPLTRSNSPPSRSSRVGAADPADPAPNPSARPTRSATRRAHQPTRPPSRPPESA